MAKYKPDDKVFWINSFGEVILEVVVSEAEASDYRKKREFLIDGFPTAVVTRGVKAGDIGWLLEEELFPATEAAMILYGNKE